MSEVGLKRLVADIREISHHYRAKAAIQLNSTIIDERWEIGNRGRTHLVSYSGYSRRKE